MVITSANKAAAAFEDPQNTFVHQTFPQQIVCLNATIVCNHCISLPVYMRAQLAKSSQDATSA